MGTKVLLAFICWLTISDTFAVSAKTVNNSVVQDNKSEASAPRLYRNVPAGVYASAAPYGAYTIQFPSFLSAPKAAASHINPVKHENIVFQNANGYLKDSYGNRFVDAPQMISYKSAFPQQFVQLQELPAHLAQPLVAAAPSYQFKELGPQHFVGSHFRQPSLQGPTPTPINSFVGSSQPLVYAGPFGSVAPHNLHGQVQGGPTAQQQSTSNKAVYVNQAHQQFNNIKSEPKFQRLQEAPQTVNQQNAQLQAAPANTAIHTVVNGKKTVIHVKTKPPLPLLDISLLEPLTFANPLVPQVQHFLPRISQATYHKLPQPNLDAVNYQKEFVVKKTKSYDSGNIKGKKPIIKKKPKKPQPPQHEILDEEEAPPNPTVTFKGTPNDGPEFSYEINSPTYKETYKEKAIRYNKETNSEPVSYTYGTNTQNEPVTYSYARSSKEPMQLKQIHYESNGKGPTQLIYNFKPEHDEKSHDGPSHSNSEDTRETFEDDDDGPRSYHQNAEHKGHYEEAPRQSQNYKPEHREENYHHRPKEEYQQRPKEEYQQRPKEEYEQRSKEEHKPRPKEEYQERPKEEYEQRPKEEYDQRPKEEYEQRPKEEYDQRPKEEYEQRPKEEYDQRPKEEYEQRPKEEYQQRPKEEVYHKEVHHNPSRHNTQHQNSPHHGSPHHYSQPLEVPVQSAEPIQAITQEYEEDIHILPTHRPNAPIKVDPSQHVQHERHRPESHDEQDAPAPAGPQNHQYEQNQEHLEHPITYPRVQGPAQQIHEKSKRVIIQEETPDEMHSLREQMIAEMINQEENNEEDFEKAYKDAAFGFPAYSRQTVDVEKNIYDPGLYGGPREHSEYNIEHTPFQQYQDEGDEYPKASRLTYKDSRDKTKEDYYSDYAVNKPESLNERNNKKVDYYKLYKQSKPERYFADEEHEDKKKEKQSAKYTAVPSFQYNPAPEQKPKQFAHYKAAPQRYEYDYSKGTPRDNSAFASGPHQRYRSRTHFVEPQFQYGFEPISIPRLLVDSELAAMASNNSPESEKPGMRKKVYKENWYIKKTSTSGGEPS